MPVLFTPAARADYEDTVRWYGEHAPDMVQPFRQAIRFAVARISENPYQFPLGPHDTRRALLRRFPYLIIFREYRDSAYIVAVFHTSRNPRTWQGRVEQ